MGAGKPDCHTGCLRSQQHLIGGKNDQSSVSAYEYKLTFIKNIEIIGNVNTPANVVINGNFVSINTNGNIQGVKIVAQSDIPNGGAVVYADGGSHFNVVNSILNGPSDGNSYTRNIRGLSVGNGTSNGWTVTVNNCYYAFYSFAASVMKYTNTYGSNNGFSFVSDGAIIIYTGSEVSSSNGPSTQASGVIVPPDSILLSDSVAFSSMDPATKMMFMNGHNRFTVRCSNYKGAGILANLGAGAMFIHVAFDWSSSGTIVSVGFKSDGAQPVFVILHNTASGSLSLGANSLGTVAISGGSQANIVQFAIVVKRHDTIL